MPRNLLGPFSTEYGWVPGPRYLLRRDLVLRKFSSYQPGSVLEVGCGAGTLLSELATKGFVGTGVETSRQAQALARYFNRDRAVHIVPVLPIEKKSGFDYLMSFEVLEHIKDDASALRSWATLLKPGGLVVVSVPSDPRRWSDSDVYAGHYRRYTHDALIELFKKAELDVVSIESYGWPLSNLVEPIRIKSHSKKLQKTTGDKAEGTAISGVDRSLDSKLFWLYGNIVGYAFLQIFSALQRSKLGENRGNGYLIVGKKREAAN